jgi:dethiobiotin synthetase
MSAPAKAEKKAFFVTGTDTDAGKTFASCALLAAAKRQGMSTLGLKPVAAGCEETADGLRNDDALALMRESSVQLSYEQVNPVTLRAAIAPHIAAQEEGVALDKPGLLKSSRPALEAAADFMLVEGAGGWRVPLNAEEDLSDYAEALALPVILVVGLKLGCLNHALLTIEAIKNSGLRLAGWIGNQPLPEPMSRQQANIETLNARIEAPCIGIIPHGDSIIPALSADHLDLSRLI